MTTQSKRSISEREEAVGVRVTPRLDPAAYRMLEEYAAYYGTNPTAAAKRLLTEGLRKWSAEER